MTNPYLSACVTGVFDRAFLILGYGSAVFKQARHLAGTPDFLIVTDDVSEFHRVNVARYPQHYSFLRYTGHRPFAYLNKSAPFVHYSVNATLATGLTCKYGVVGKTDLLRTMRTWESLYLPGRLHKPIAIIDSVDKVTRSDFEDALLLNRLNALRLAALLSPAPCTASDLIERVIGLSYLGDVRMGVAERPDKVRAILEGQREELDLIYMPLMPKAGLVETERGYCANDMVIDSLPQILSSDLPKQRADYQRELVRRVCFLNARDSVMQAAKGLLTNPISKTTLYTLRKVRKKLVI